MLVKGSDLTEEQKRQVFNGFIYRWTYDNPHRVRSWGSCPSCDIKTPYVNTKTSKGHNHPTIPLISDSEWLNNYMFEITEKGNLSPTRRYAVPTYEGVRYHDKEDI